MPQWWMPAVQKARLDRDFDDTWFEYGLGAAVQTGKTITSMLMSSAVPAVIIKKTGSGMSAPDGVSK